METQILCVSKSTATKPNEKSTGMLGTDIARLALCTGVADESRQTLYCYIFGTIREHGIDIEVGRNKIVTIEFMM